MRQKFDQEFKEQAVKMAIEKKIPVTRLALDLGVGKSTLNKWVSTYKRGDQISSGLTAEQKEIKRLKRENEVLKEERDILKKAMAIFSCPKKRNSLL